MQYAEETGWIVNILLYGTWIIAVALIWWKSRHESEQYVLLKLAGYSFLGAFRFIINSFPLPIGFAAAYLIAKKATLNRNAKLWSVMLGGFIFLVSLLPLRDWVEEALYPRDDIKTYLYADLTQNNAFDIMLSNNKGITFRSFSKRPPGSGGADELGMKLYAELRKSASSTHWVIQPAWNFEIHQQDKPGGDRFRMLPFTFDMDGRYAVLNYENREHVFETTPEFQALFKQVLVQSKQIDK